MDSVSVACSGLYARVLLTTLRCLEVSWCKKVPQSAYASLVKGYANLETQPGGTGECCAIPLLLETHPKP